MASAAVARAVAVPMVVTSCPATNDGELAGDAGGDGAAGSFGEAGCGQTVGEQAADGDEDACPGEFEGGVLEDVVDLLAGVLDGRGVVAAASCEGLAGLRECGKQCAFAGSGDALPELLQCVEIVGVVVAGE